MDDRPKPRPRRSSTHQLMSDDSQVEQGVVNPAVQMDSETAYQTFSQTEGESSAAEIEEIGQAKSLVKDLKTRRRQRQKELSKLTTPKDDVTGELKTVKMKSKQKVEETSREGLEEAVAEARQAAEAKDEIVTLPAETEDGTVTMPTEDGTVTMPTETEDGTIPMPDETITKTEEAALETVRTEEVPSARLEETTEKPPETPTSSRGMSLRARMRSRVQKAKEQAETELREEAREERQRLKDLRQKTLTRFDTEMSDVDIEKLAEERRRKVKQRWAKMGMTDMQESGLPSTKAAYDFFTRHWSSDEEEDKEVRVIKPKQEAEETAEGEETEAKTAQPEDEQEEETTDDKKPLLGEKDVIEGEGLIVIRKPEFIDPVEKKKLEDKLLFVPSTAPVPSAEKITEELQPRYLEEEGFYVGVRPEIPVRNQNKMEQRLVHQPDNKGRDWFGEDGKIIALPNPLRPSPSRPAVPDEPDPDLETVFRKAIVREFDQRYIDGAIEGSGHYQLDVDINSLEFSHHHLFSREHVLSEKLFDLYQQYFIRKKKNMTEFLREKLQALKGSKIHLEEHISNNKSQMSASDRKNYEKRLKDYKYEIKQTRLMRDREEEIDRTLLKNNIHTWKELKAQREEQGYTNTSLKLNITSEESNKVEDQVWWKNEMEEELSELREEFEEEYKRSLAIYSEQMQALENQKQQKEEAKKKLKKSQKGSRVSVASKTSNDLNEEERNALQEIIDAPDLPEPEPPEHFDENIVREEIKKKALKIRRRPGEPKLLLVLTNSAVVTPTNQCPVREQQRRDDVSHTKLFVKVFFNNKQVCQTNSKPLSQDFTVNFGYIYNLKIVQWPESIKYEIHESHGLSSVLLTRLYAGIPESSITAQNVQLDEFEFSSEHTIQFNHEAVGSGVPFTFKTPQSPIIILMTTGRLRSSVAWGIDENGLPLIPPATNLTTNNIFNAMKLNDPVSAIGTSGVMNLERLAKWFEQARLDPNDPANADFVYLLGSKGGESLGPRDFFRLEQLIEEFNIATEKEIAENKRFRLIQLRDSEVPEFQNYKFIPPFEREIPRDAFLEYEKRQREREVIKSDSNIEIRHAVAQKNMQKVRDKVMHHLRQQAHQKVFQDVVKEDTLPPFIDLVSELMFMTEKRRPLKPARKKLDPRPIIRGPHDPPPYILVNIIRAFDIPIRKSALSEGGEGGTTSRRDTVPNILATALVQPFVEAIFQETIVQTSVVDGPNPSFNEELRIALEAPANDYSARSLQKITDILYLNLFDEVVHDLESESQRKTKIHQRIERKWLGSLQIPFSTIYLNSKIDGIFRIRKPPILLGYSSKENANDTYLQVFITTQPPLKIPEPVKYKFPSVDKEKLLERCDKWQTEIESKFPKRQYVTTVVDMNCKTVFVTRYLKAMKPPEEILAGGEEKVAWFVSLIPFVPDAFVFPGMSDLWSSCDQFIQLLAGDEEEHSVLLANYFMSMGKTTYLITGTAIPEGPTVYVLTKEADRGYRIWNAGTAESFDFRDSRCPLISIGCLINSENIWANIQAADKPARLDFDLTKTSAWKPFFDSSYPFPGLGSIQPESLIYEPVDENSVVLLKETIEQALKNKIMDWRSRFITRWNRHCTQIMRKILPSLEESCGKAPNQQYLQELESSFSQYKVSGFPLHMEFTNLEHIIQTLRATGVHSQETSDIEFALAVYVKAYPSSIMSVWVYVASLIRIR